MKGLGIIELEALEDKWFEETILPVVGEDTYSEKDEFDYDFFRLENFQPEHFGKDVGSGSWVKVKTDKGWDIFWAKRSKKILDTSFFKRKIKSLKAKITQLSRLDADRDFYEFNDKLDKVKAEVEKNQQDLYKAMILEEADIQPYFVKVNITRTQVMYLLPTEYEIISDISPFADLIGHPSKAVKFKALFTAQDNDLIFYLQQRGISKEKAMMMAKMKNGYFQIDRNNLVENIFTPV
jgi:hypothetical protein